MKLDAVGARALLSEEPGQETLAVDLELALTGRGAAGIVFQVIPGGFYANHGKRIVDVLGGLALLIVALPLLIALFSAIQFSGGQPIYRHARVGRDGIVFDCLKFRTMALDADAALQTLLETDAAAAAEWKSTHKLRNDPRITPLGRFLRKSSLDELPQAWNVVRGEMSLVGPRPVTHEELPNYGCFLPAYKSIRPGLTGPWQVGGRNDLRYDERVRLDAEYAQNVSFVRDVAIILRTPVSMLRATGR